MQPNTCLTYRRSSMDLSSHDSDELCERCANSVQRHAECVCRSVCGWLRLMASVSLDVIWWKVTSQAVCLLLEPSQSNLQNPQDELACIPRRGTLTMKPQPVIMWVRQERVLFEPIAQFSKECVGSCSSATGNISVTCPEGQWIFEEALEAQCLPKNGKLLKAINAMIEEHSAEWVVVVENACLILAGHQAQLAQLDIANILAFCVEVLGHAT
mmetsp:Transcript_110701/g.352593  ORF Transcript_110701/g.352593 Transcript_110701/m.352593 type:complete len:213 (-) Transcript_110701:1886-2524(-)